MATNPDIVKKAADYTKKFITLKIISVGILILLLLIPTGMVQPKFDKIFFNIV